MFTPMFATNCIEHRVFFIFYDCVCIEICQVSTSGTNIVLRDSLYLVEIVSIQNNRDRHRITWLHLAYHVHDFSNSKFIDKPGSPRLSILVILSSGTFWRCWCVEMKPYPSKIPFTDLIHKESHGNFNFFLRFWSTFNHIMFSQNKSYQNKRYPHSIFFLKNTIIKTLLHMVECTIK